MSNLAADTLTTLPTSTPALLAPSHSSLSATATTPTHVTHNFSGTSTMAASTTTTTTTTMMAGRAGRSRASAVRYANFDAAAASPVLTKPNRTVTLDVRTNSTGTILGVFGAMQGWRKTMEDKHVLKFPLLDELNGGSGAEEACGNNKADVGSFFVESITPRILESAVATLSEGPTSRGAVFIGAAVADATSVSSSPEQATTNSIGNLAAVGHLRMKKEEAGLRVNTEIPVVTTTSKELAAAGSTADSHESTSPHTIHVVVGGTRRHSLPSSSGLFVAAGSGAAAAATLSTATSSSAAASPTQVALDFNSTLAAATNTTAAPTPTAAATAAGQTSPLLFPHPPKQSSSVQQQGGGSRGESGSSPSLSPIKSKKPQGVPAVNLSGGGVGGGNSAVVEGREGTQRKGTQQQQHEREEDAPFFTVAAVSEPQSTASSPRGGANRCGAGTGSPSSPPLLSSAIGGGLSVGRPRSGRDLTIPPNPQEVERSIGRPPVAPTAATATAAASSLSLQNNHSNDFSSPSSCRSPTMAVVAAESAQSQPQHNNNNNNSGGLTVDTTATSPLKTKLRTYSSPYKSTRDGASTTAGADAGGGEGGSPIMYLSSSATAPPCTTTTTTTTGNRQGEVSGDEGPTASFSFSSGGVTDPNGYVVFGVFDGHRGAEASTFVSEALPPKLVPVLQYAAVMHSARQQQRQQEEHLNLHEERSSMRLCGNNSKDDTADTKDDVYGEGGASRRTNEPIATSTTDGDLIKEHLTGTNENNTKATKGSSASPTVLLDADDVFICDCITEAFEDVDVLLREEHEKQLKARAAAPLSISMGVSGPSSPSYASPVYTTNNTSSAVAPSPLSTSITTAPSSPDTATASGGGGATTNQPFAGRRRVSGNTTNSSAPGTPPPYRGPSLGLGIASLRQGDAPAAGGVPATMSSDATCGAVCHSGVSSASGSPSPQRATINREDILGDGCSRISETPLFAIGEVLQSRGGGLTSGCSSTAPTPRASTSVPPPPTTAANAASSSSFFPYSSGNNLQQQASVVTSAASSPSGSPNASPSSASAPVGLQGSTAHVVVVTADRYYFCNVGDSRGYLVTRRSGQAGEDFRLPPPAAAVNYGGAVGGGYGHGSSKYSRAQSPHSATFSEVDNGSLVGYLSSVGGQQQQNGSPHGSVGARSRRTSQAPMATAAGGGSQPTAPCEEPDKKKRHSFTKMVCSGSPSPSNAQSPSLGPRGCPPHDITTSSGSPIGGCSDSNASLLRNGSSSENGVPNRNTTAAERKGEEEGDVEPSAIDSAGSSAVRFVISHTSGRQQHYVNNTQSNRSHSQTNLSSGAASGVVSPQPQPQGCPQSSAIPSPSNFVVLDDGRSSTHTQQEAISTNHATKLPEGHAGSRPHSSLFSPPIPMAITVRAMSEDHRTANDAERRRVVAAGGYVLNNRVNNKLSVTRAFGDLDHKPNPPLPRSNPPLLAGWIAAQQHQHQQLQQQQQLFHTLTNNSNKQLQLQQTSAGCGGASGDSALGYVSQTSSMAGGGNHPSSGGNCFHTTSYAPSLAGSFAFSANDIASGRVRFTSSGGFGSGIVGGATGAGVTPTTSRTTQQPAAVNASFASATTALGIPHPVSATSLYSSPSGYTTTPSTSFAYTHSVPTSSANAFVTSSSFGAANTTNGGEDKEKEAPPNCVIATPEVRTVRRARVPAKTPSPVRRAFNSSQRSASGRGEQWTAAFSGCIPTINNTAATTTMMAADASPAGSPREVQVPTPSLPVEREVAKSHDGRVGGTGSPSSPLSPTSLAVGSISASLTYPSTGHHNTSSYSAAAAASASGSGVVRALAGDNHQQNQLQQQTGTTSADVVNRSHSQPPPRDNHIGDGPFPQLLTARPMAYDLLLVGCDGVWELESAESIGRRIVNAVESVLDRFFYEPPAAASILLCDEGHGAHRVCDEEMQQEDPTKEGPDRATSLASAPTADPLADTNPAAIMGSTLQGGTVTLSEVEGAMKGLSELVAAGNSTEKEAAPSNNDSNNKQASSESDVPTIDVLAATVTTTEAGESCTSASGTCAIATIAKEMGALLAATAGSPSDNTTDVTKLQGNIYSSALDASTTATDEGNFHLTYAGSELARLGSTLKALDLTTNSVTAASSFRRDETAQSARNTEPQQQQQSPPLTGISSGRAAQVGGSSALSSTSNVPFALPRSQSQLTHLLAEAMKEAVTDSLKRCCNHNCDVRGATPGTDNLSLGAVLVFPPECIAEPEEEGTSTKT